MAKRKAKPRKRAASTKLIARKTSSRVRRETAVRGVSRFGLPLVLSALMLACLAVFGYSVYESATTSDFFDVTDVEISGIERTSEDDLRRVITAEAEKPGVWNADLGEIKAKVEKFPFVKSAAVSRVLPAGIRVDVIERIPVAVVDLTYGNYLVDGEGTLLTAVQGQEKDFPFMLKGWDESKTEKAGPANLARLKIYGRMLDEWRQFDLIERVKEVDLWDTRYPVALIEDSGRPITVSLARDDLGKSLRIAIEAVSGKGAKVRSVNAAGVSPVITYLEF